MSTLQATPKLKLKQFETATFIHNKLYKGVWFTQVWGFKDRSLAHLQTYNKEYQGVFIKKKNGPKAENSQVI